MHYINTEDKFEMLEMFDISDGEAKRFLNEKPITFWRTYHELRRQIISEYEFISEQDGSVRLHPRERLNIPSYVAEH